MTLSDVSAGSASAGPAAGADFAAGAENENWAARTRGLRKTYGKTVAVDQVDLDVPSGAVLGMLGPNGSGKTTTIRMLLGLTQPTEGTVELLGRSMPDEARQVLPSVGALVEGPGFHPHLSGRDNLRRCAAAEPLIETRYAKQAVSEALERVGLADASDRPFKGYSLGMKQRLGLAAALLVPRNLVVLDEPTNGLDPAGTREIRQVIADLHQAGTTVIVSSHLLAEIEATCTHVAVLKRGLLVAQGSLGDLLSASNATLQVTTPDAERGVEALRSAGVPARVEGDGIRAELIDSAAPFVIATLVRADVEVYEAKPHRTGLEDFFALVTEESDSEEQAR
ncbi:ABC transporter ATP-binding protein [Actinoalloteichus hymeniacidonis]|uniref:ABC-type multidrug transport system, ATPase component n=1 Tax=Actinoalloteichus hymeniacidonis TaxID=340345 RepID=A0AAC9MWZ9_9PSEU|nr:ATP-binding cassette domain-containing protein [Actinoalloteichus hymeniacidonis]AOS61709.1 ABC-type multidrug transport system, ATPase component [Actinoalloteichus hymeniacidonis]MBB5910273.1 ABC-2 type transport system ATP-binding protein [Actinoalloteichus hymeniacidonis]